MMHHIVSDRSSFGIFWREVAAVYKALCRRESFALPTSSIQFPDYAAWQSQQFSEAQSSDDLSFWVENLSGAAGILELPTDRPRPLSISYSGAKQRLRLSSVLSSDLRAFTRREQISLYTVFVGALKALLYRYTGQEDLLVGIPIADRERAELQSVIGFLVDTQVLRTRLSGDMPFVELLALVRRGLLNVYRHRSVPFDQVVQHVQPERNPAYSPLFQVMINWRDRDLQLPFIGLEGLAVEPLLAESRTSKNDLTLFVTDGGDEVHVEIEYNTDLFDADRIRRMSEHLEVLLEGALRNPGQRLSQLPLLTEEEKRRLLVDWNATERAYPRDTPLAVLMEAQVERSPDAVAVIFGESSITYRALNARANQLAQELQRQGAGPDRLVGVCLKRSIDMVVALLAIIKAGAAYLPLEPDLPRQRLDHMIDDSEMEILVTQRELHSLLPVFVGPIVDVDRKEWVASRFENHPVTVDPGQLAYVIYTSGSTGKPKGVEVLRGALTNFLWSMKESLQLDPGRATLAATTISFDIAGLEIWLPLLVGSPMVLVSREAAMSGEELALAIKRHDVRLAQATPTTWRLLLESGWAGKADLTAICGGEALPREVASRLRPLVRSLWNMYGPTETTIWSTGSRIEKIDGPIVIGRPIANTQCYILDDCQQPMPVGRVGELYIGGHGLARGYRNQAQLTGKKFVPNPFLPGERMYRTGDLARYRIDGSIESLGRTDNQVKLRGYLIEAGEIEAVLDAHPAIRQSVVVKREDRPGDSRLVAYFIPRDTAVPERSELRALLKRTLPDYMVPSEYVAVDSFPMTHNGKIDRLTLPAPKMIDPPGTPEYVPPEDAFQSLVCDAWAEILGLSRVGIRDNFFELGGHSLLAMRLMLRLQEIIPGEPLPLRALLEAPTVEQFADWLRRRKADDRQFLVRVRPGSPDRPPFFCVHGAGGNVLNMRALAMALPQDLPFFTFQDKGLDGSQPFESIEDTARCYLDELRRVQPRGPYYIGGNCYGGSVAFEMARILEQQGEAAALLVLIDSSNPAFARSMSMGQRLFREARLLVRRMTWHAPKIFLDHRHEQPAYIGGRFAALWKRLRTLGKVGPTMADFQIVAGTRFGEDLTRVVQANILALSEFVPKPYDGTVLIFRASGRSLLPYDDFYLGWKSVVRGQVESFEIEGDHMSILEQPAVQLMADTLNAKLVELTPGREFVSSGHLPG